jgi:transcription initiation factor TFIIB
MERSKETNAIIIDNQEQPDGNNKCPECGSINIITDYDTKERACGDCGFVFGSEMDMGPERRAFTDEEKEKRVRTVTPQRESFHDKDLGSQIKPGPDALRKKLPAADYFRMQCLSKIQRQASVQKSSERNLAKAMDELYKIAGKLNIPRSSLIIEQVATAYRKALAKDLIIGHTIIALVAASFYYVFREMGIPRTLDEIVQASGVKEKFLTRCYRLMLKTFEKHMPVPDSISYVSKIAEPIGISGNTQTKAINILWQAKRKRVRGGKNPMGLAAAALYIACLQNQEKILIGQYKIPTDVTQKIIAESAGVTEVTVRNRYKRLQKELNLEIPEGTENPSSFCFRYYLLTKYMIGAIITNRGKMKAIFHFD